MKPKHGSELVTLSFDVLSDCRLTNVNQVEKYIFVEKYGMNIHF